MHSRLWKWLCAIPIVYLLYLFRITAVGILGPDEPRYASIGRQMARSGDWVTPCLWGAPWFEKPALLYWMIGAAQKAGLGDDLSPRLPVALLAVAFLVLYFFWMRTLFDGDRALYAAAMLATAAGWVAFSQIGVTDLPLAVFFSTAILLTARWQQDGDWRLAALAGISLGFAILAKGLVPIALSVPLVWTARKRFGQLLLFGAAAVLTAAPWYLAVTAQNGRAFLDEFFWKHHFQRFSTEALLHQQPVWFYLPVLMGALFPWTPAFLLLNRRLLREESNARYFLLIVVWGVLFFSLSRNKLPGYLLPLLPAACAVGGAALASAKRWRVPVFASALLLALLPVIAEVLPQALQSGLSRSRVPPPVLWSALPLAVLAVVVLKLDRKAAVLSLACGAALGVAYLKIRVYPVLEETTSARSVWRQVGQRGETTCVDAIHRNWRYGLNYYSVEPLPECSESSRPTHIIQQPGRRPTLAATTPSSNR